MSQPEPINVTPTDIQKDIDPTFYSSSCNSHYLVYNSPTVANQVDIFGAGLPTTENRTSVQVDPDWCTISSDGHFIAYGERHNSRRPSGYIDCLDSAESLRVPGIVTALFVAEKLWTLRLVRKELRIEIRQAPKWKVAQSLTIKNYVPDLYSEPDLLHIHRPNAVLLRLNTFESTLIKQDQSGNLSDQELVGLLGLNCKYHVAPHGGEITAVQDVGLYRLLDPFREVQSHIRLPTYGTNGCYLDDVHFLGMGPKGVLYLVHTRSSTLVAHFTIADNVRYRLLNASRFSNGQILLTLAGTEFAKKAQRYLIPTEAFLGSL